MEICAVEVNPFTLYHRDLYSIHSSLYISIGTDKENLFINQSFLSW